jgi:predicted dehydrogenase
VAVQGRLADGALASIHLTTGSPTGAGYRIEAHGRSGRALLRSNDASLVAPELALFVSNGSHDDYALLPVPGRYGAGDGLRDAPVAVRNVGQVYAGLAEAIRTDTPVEPNFDTALGLHHVLDAIERSASAGVRQSLPRP